MGVKKKKARSRLKDCEKKTNVEFDKSLQKLKKKCVAEIL